MWIGPAPHRSAQSRATDVVAAVADLRAMKTDVGRRVGGGRARNAIATLDRDASAHDLDGGASPLDRSVRGVTAVTDRGEAVVRTVAGSSPEAIGSSRHSPPGS